MSEPQVPPPGQPVRLTLRLMLRRWLRRYLPLLSLGQRAAVQVLLREASTPDFDYFALIGLSSVMATLGLLIDSVAVIIGAMVVAPLMSPILGGGPGVADRRPPIGARRGAGDPARHGPDGGCGAGNHARRRTAAG